MLDSLFCRILLVISWIVSMPFFFGSSLATSTRQVNPEIYKNEILFDVYRDGDRVGSHKVVFVKTGNSLEVRSKFSLQIDFLFLTAFKYFYESVEVWQNGRLVRLEADVDDDGISSRVGAILNGGQFTIQTGDLSYTANAPIFPTNHWHAGVLKQTRVLNTLTGRINSVEIISKEREAISTENGLVQATRFVYKGDLQNEVLYDDDGRWVKMRFNGRDGTPIEYICRSCQGLPPVSGTMEYKPVNAN